MTLVHREMLWYIIQYHYNKKGAMRHITKRENKSKQNSEEKQAAYCVSAKGEVNSTSVSEFRPLHLTKTAH